MRYLTSFSVVFAVVGFILDAYSTDIGIKSGAKESNPIRRWLIGKLGHNGGTYGVAIALSTSIVSLALLIDPLPTGFWIGNMIAGAAFWWAAIHNYKIARRANGRT